ncbi:MULTISPECIES: hypothetical protein [Prauserella salsuginis group]|uniref:Uncharacterized protein n=2 Tax=Prauserella salsuginis group TaxID=2893672 RepID=A0A839XME3_9PSEU|nr:MULTISPECIES: hypothetical protein [Prauserella salsuginis group]MBB3663807.1 hypothetical protein [Prauserella sediminis]MCR3722414.1 hypothetical protein [Prauserella flava]MCR3736856.1 hypothetical protein [Prauserella salsuginis]
MTSDGTEQPTGIVDGDQHEASDETQHPESSPQQVVVSDVPAASAGASGSANGILGGIAVVSAGLGLSSLIGNPLSDMLRARQEIVGQIEAGAGGGGDQIEAFYGAPWHTTALVNGVIALVAAVVGGIVLLAYARRSDKRPWVTALAVGGVVLGVLGLLLAGGMYLDLFAAQPELPAAPQLGTGG